MGNHLHTLSASSVNKTTPYTVETSTLAAFHPGVQKQAPITTATSANRRPAGRKNMNYSFKPSLRTASINLIISWSLKDKQKLVGTKAWGISTGMGASMMSSKHSSVVRLHSLLQKHFSFMYWSGLGWYLKAWQTRTITAWRTWISWVFLLTSRTTTLPSLQWPLHVLKALQLTDLIAQVSKVINHYKFNNFSVWVCCHYFSSCTVWEKVINTNRHKKVHVFLHVPIFI